ncbi:MAG: excinuclease ABC subunit UvrC, partial [Bacteroidetes bacterium]|nr:excinuclease ABC subunit UvrC [Bacteroidota bacterium]
MIVRKFSCLSTTIRSLPGAPGVYQFYDRIGKLLYVGKAKNLKKRVASYFTKSHDSGKTRVMVAKIADIKHIVVETESDALLLENNLIKKYQPRYNVLLKDDKTFPWICIKNEPFPRVFRTRTRFNDGSLYFGPYTSVLMVRAILDMIRRLYPLRTCKHTLSAENIRSGKFKVCLEYHIGNCLAPCIGAQDQASYDRDITDIRNILKGNLHSVSAFMKETMAVYAESQRFEEAQAMKERIEILEKYRSKSTIVNPVISDVDVFSILDDEKAAYVNFLHVSNGAIVQVHTLELKKKLEETCAELLPFAITEIRQRMFSNSREIIVPFQTDYEWPQTRITVPVRGDKKKLLELSQRNVKYFILEKQKQKSATNPNWRTDRILDKIKTDLHLTELPITIECFDNSNIQGSTPVASCVIFKNAKPSKKNYRKYNIKTVTGPDDFASMAEVVHRRYRRLLSEKKSLPQLIVIDGGKGQLNAAAGSLEKLGLRGTIAVIGIAKKLEEIYFPGDPVPLYLDKTSETLRLIQQLRNEAHRFGIRFHREKRSKEFTRSELDAITGIGPKTIESLMHAFASTAQIKAATEEELAGIIGRKKAGIIQSYYTANSL